MGALVLSRLLHPLGMYATPGSLKFMICRGGSIFLTIGLLISTARDDPVAPALGGRRR